MAHKKGVGSSRNGRDSGPKYLGVKTYGGEQVVADAANQFLVLEREKNLHPMIEVARHEVGAAGVHLLVAAVVEIEDAGVLEEAPHHADHLACPRQQR